ncbi:NAD(P)H oxidoreductase [Flavobacteriaceae bacterium Ap0902]|nr:NAD(P)H oxidoreductase [Flavobacteriaceae bacterium Ap0902]
MKKILILFAHPKFEKSRTNKIIIDQVKGLEHVTVQDLYEEYPSFHIDVDKEQALLMQHDIIIWQHPIYWYSCPPLLKMWIDEVLEYGWAYGAEGNALKNKTIFNAITTGGTRWKYDPAGVHSYSIKEFLRPFEQTAKICGMKYLPAYAVMGVHQLTDKEIEAEAIQYVNLLQRLQRNEVKVQFDDVEYLNEIQALKK